jgi:hypothetical protein
MPAKFEGILLISLYIPEEFRISKNFVIWKIKFIF